MNYHRGFDEWRFIRGQEFDPYRTGYSGTKPDLDEWFTPKMDRNSTTGRLFPYYLRSHEHRQGESEYQSPKVFRSAMRWLEENYNKNTPFFLYIESFDVHEPWDPPQYYRDMYDSGYTGTKVIQPIYTDRLDYLSDAELKHVRALYAAEVTMVDTWLGYFIHKVRQLNLMDDTIIVLISDHGTMLGENGVMGKPPFCMFPALMDLVFFIKAPGQPPKIIDTLVYNHYYFPTVLYLLGEEIHQQAEGKNLWDLVEGEKDKFIDYATSVFKNWGWVRDDRYIFISRPTGDEAQLYDLYQDPACATNIAGKEPKMVEKMHARLLKDAGGDMPHYNVPWRYSG
jgi:arylsulfatase A-like enzyme